MITVLTSQTCSWCDELKKVMQEKNIPYVEVSVPEQMSVMEFHALSEKHEMTKTVPKVFSGTELIGGYDDDLLAWFDEWLDSHAGGYGEDF